jgi:hypothetical protein
MELIKKRTETEKQLQSDDGLETKKKGLMAGFPRKLGIRIES